MDQSNIRTRSAEMVRPSDIFTPMTIDDLPKYSPWPKRLLSQDPFEVKNKSEKEVLREFEDERWGGLLEKVRALTSPTLLDIEKVYTDVESIPQL